MDYKCIFCNDNDSKTSRIDDGYIVECPHCGCYKIKNRNFVDLSFANQDIAHVKRMVSCYLFLNKEGCKVEELSSAKIQHVLSATPRTISEKIDAILRYVESHTMFYGEEIDLPSEVIYSAEDSIIELENICNALEEKGFLKVYPYINGTIFASLTIEGYEFLKSKPAGANSDACFVAMWFDSSMEASYTNGIQTACLKAGYRPIRVDKEPHNGDITDRIINDINSTRFTIADLTGDRGGVYYEAGYARGIGKEVILCCRSDSFPGVHFDLNHINIVVWDNPEDLVDKLYERIIATIGRGSSCITAPV